MRVPHSTALLTAAALVLTLAGTAQAQARFEIGSTLAGVAVGLGDDNDATLVGIPSAGFGLIDPAAYASIFLGEHLALEPKVGLFWVKSDGESDHVLNLVGQATYFLSGTARPSLYVVGAAGVIDSSGEGPNPKTFAGGVGYRVPVGDRLAFRFDGRYLHATEDGGNQVLVTLSIGGVFGR